MNKLFTCIDVADSYIKVSGSLVQLAAIENNETDKLV